MKHKLQLFLLILSTFISSISYAATFQCYPASGNYNTGTCRSNNKTEESIVQGYRNRDGWFKFDLSSIPSGSTVTGVEFYGYVYETNWPYWSITPVSNDPVTTAASTLYDDINDEATFGYYLFREEAEDFSTGWHNYTLGGNIVSDLQSALSQDWIAMGMVSRDDSRDYYIGFDGWDDSNPPYLLVNCTIPSSVDDPSAFSAAPYSSSRIDLSWTANSNGDDVMIAYNTENIFGIPVDGNSYSAGNAISGGGTVLYVGSSSSFNHNSLSSPQTYYYTAWSFNASHTYSSGLNESATTPIAAFPWSEDFDSSTSTPTEWTNDSSDPWIFSNSATYGASSDHTSGSGNLALVDDSEPYANPSNLITPPFDLSSLSTPQLDFYYWIGTSTSGSTLYLDIFDGSVWNENVASYTLNDQWDQASIIISAYSSDATKIRFRGDEQTSNYSCDICIDDISISEGPADPVFSVDPASHDYGTLFAGLSLAHTFTISNQGGGTLGITSISLSGSDADQFSLDGSTTGSLASGESMAIDVLFNPDSDGTKNATLVITDDFSGSHNVSLTGEGNDATISTFPYTENFDASTSTPTDWINESAEPWEFDNSTTYGADEDHTSGSGNFAFVDDSTPYSNPHELVTPPFDLSGLSNPELEFYYWIGNGTSGSSLNVDVFDGSSWQNSVQSFTANNGWIEASVMLGAFSSEVTMIRFSALEQTTTYNCDICLDDVTIQEGPSAPLFAVDPAVKDFGDYNLGSSLLNQTFTVRNDGGGTLTISSVAITGTDASDFTLTDTNSYPAALISGAAITFDVTFDPAETGSKSATLVITETSTQNVSISGNAVNYNSGGGDVVNGYYFFANSLATPGPVYDWIDFSSHNLISSFTSGDEDDGYFQVPDIGFDFNFFGTNYRTNDLYISTNGFVSFGSGYSDYQSAGSASIPSSSDPNNIIAGCCMDLDAGTDGIILYGGDTTEFVITYYKYRDYGQDDEYITFQIILQPDGLIKIQYNYDLSSIDPEVSAGQVMGDALIGIENLAGSAGIEYRNDTDTGPIFNDASLAVAFSTDEGALPVELSALEAVVTNDQKIAVKWTTQSENNMIGYKIFRSQTDLYHIEYASDLIPANNTSEAHEYEYIDWEIEPMVTYNYWLQSYELDGYSYLWGPISAMVYDAPAPELPLITKLNGNYPNPFNPSTAIQFSLSTDSYVLLDIYNIKGQHVVTLIDEYLESNYHHIVWDGRTDCGKQAASGIYFYRMQAGDYQKIKKMLLQK